MPDTHMTLSRDRQSYQPQILTTEDQFLAAERAIAELGARRDALYDLITKDLGLAQTREIEAQIEPITDEIWDRVLDITASPPPTQSAAMVKLRLLIGPFGLGEEEDGSDGDSLRQVVAFLDAGLTQKPVPIAPTLPVHRPELTPPSGFDFYAACKEGAA